MCMRDWAPRANQHMFCWCFWRHESLLDSDTDKAIVFVRQMSKYLIDDRWNSWTLRFGFLKKLTFELNRVSGKESCRFFPFKSSLIYFQWQKKADSNKIRIFTVDSLLEKYDRYSRNINKKIFEKVDYCQLCCCHLNTFFHSLLSFLRFEAWIVRL